VTVGTGLAIGLAVVATVLQNIAYLREHDAAAELPALAPRHPVQSLRLLLGSRGWLAGFAMETGGFAAYAAALALASLALVQSIGAGGIGVLAFISARVSGRPLGRRRRIGALVSVAGLAALGVSLAGTSGEGGGGTVVGVIVWIAATGAAAGAVLLVTRRTGRPAIGEGIAGGLLFSVGDLSTKLVTQGGARFGFAVTLVAGYTLGTSLLQLGYQRGSVLAVAGPASLLTNALPILAGTVVLGEPVPAGGLGVARVFAFAAVTAGAILLTEEDRQPGR
jgi:hypothetical protein